MTEIFRTNAAPGHGELRLQSRHEFDSTVVSACGEVDMATAEDLERQLRAAESLEPHRLVIDLTGVSFMDSCGLRVLLKARERAESGEWDLVLRPGPPQVQRLLETSGLSERFRFQAD